MTREGCQKYAAVELEEYWRAARQGHDLTNEAVSSINEASQIDDEAYYIAYNSYAHNTTIDELADLTIVAATWYEAVKREASAVGCGPLYFVDIMFIEGILAFVADVCVHDPACESLHNVVNMKMRFNEIRAKYR